MVACFLLSSAQMRLCQMPGRRQPLITDRFGNPAVLGPALDAISIRAAVVCVPLLLCADWRQHTDYAVPSLLLKTGDNTPYPSLAGLASKGTSLPYMANAKAAATLFMVTRWRQYQYLPLLLGAGCRWIALMSCLPAICHLDPSDIKIIIQNIPPQVNTSHRVCTTCMTKNRHIWHVCKTSIICSVLK